MRNCTVCNAQGIGRTATLVATHRGLQWFECGQHEPGDHGRVFGHDTSDRTTEPLADWLQQLWKPGESQ